MTSQNSIDADLQQGLSEILQTKFGLNQFRKGQLAILQSCIQKKDTLAVMPTGGGKSLCYQIPAVYFNQLVIVISPLIALMQDQVRHLRRLGIPAGCLHSGQDLDEKRLIFAQIKQKQTYILFLSPERVQNPGFAPWLKEQNVALFAIDEAHCVSQWGHEFRQDYHKLNILRELKPNVPILALTATATPQVLNDIHRQLHLQKPDRHVHGFYRPNLFYQVETCTDDYFKFEFLLKAIRQTPHGRILIYCGTRQQCEQLSSNLHGFFEGVGYYHAGMSADDRKRTQEQVNNNQIRILAATTAFGMGIDYPDVRLVVHFQSPANIESLYQEMGRAGRDGQMSRCLLLYAKKDRGLHSYFIQQSQAEKFVIRQRWNALEALTQYVESNECRHAGILTYFRDSERIRLCGHCDVCANDSEWRVTPPEIAKIKAPGEKAFKLRKNKNPKTPEFQLVSPEAEARALLLRDWRKTYATEQDLPAFMIFSDRTLKDLANKNPRSLEELARVYGFGPQKTELLGPRILNELHGNRTSGK